MQWFSFRSPPPPLMHELVRIDDSHPVADRELLAFSRPLGLSRTVRSFLALSSTW